MIGGRPRSPWHWLALAVLVVLVAVPCTVSAASTLRVAPPPQSSASKLLPLAAPPVTVGAYALRYFGAAPGYAAAGVQGTFGLSGTTVVLAACTGACTDRYRPASAPAIAAGHYAERQIFTVVQPGTAGPAVGFDVEVAVHLTTGWVVGTGYFSTGVSTGAGTSTISLRVYVDLGTAAPTVTAVDVTVDRCLSTTACP